MGKRLDQCGDAFSFNALCINYRITMLHALTTTLLEILLHFPALVVCFACSLTCRMFSTFSGRRLVRLPVMRPLALLKPIAFDRLDGHFQQPWELWFVFVSFCRLNLSIAWPHLWIWMVNVHEFQSFSTALWWMCIFPHREWNGWRRLETARLKTTFWGLLSSHFPTVCFVA